MYIYIYMYAYIHTERIPRLCKVNKTHALMLTWEYVSGYIQTHILT